MEPLDRAGDSGAGEERARRSWAAVWGWGVTAARPWTDVEDAFIRDRYVADGATRIARDLGRTFSSVAHRAERLGVIRYRRWTPGDDLELELLWGGCSLKSLSAQLKRTEATLYWRAQVLDLELGCPQGYEYLTAAAVRTGFAVGQLRAVLRAAGVNLRAAISRPGRPRPCRRMHFVPPDAVDEAVSLWHRSETVESVARRHGVCGDTIRDWLREARAAGAPVPPEPKQHKARWRVPSGLADRLVAERRERMSLREHQVRLAITRQTLVAWLRTAGVRPTGQRRWMLPASVVDGVVGKEMARHGCRARRTA